MNKSHLLQMRGLKLILANGAYGKRVASFTDAWIETNDGKNWTEIGKVASFTDAWIETITCCIYGCGTSRIFYRCVD